MGSSNDGEGKLSDEEQQQLRDLEKQLTATDAVLRPDILRAATCYLKLRKGKIADVIQKLSEGYVGYPAMASMVCEWMRMLPEQEPPPSDEFSYLTKLVEDKFEPDAFASLLAHGCPPAWAEQLVADRQGRQLIYSLASQHGHSLFLGWAIKRTLQLGHEDEIVATGPAMAAYFGVFHRLLPKLLASMVACQDGTQRTEALTRLQEMATLGQHTYVFTQALLSTAATDANWHILRRIQQECAVRAQAQLGPKIHAVIPLVHSGCQPEQYAAARLVASVLTAPQWQDIRVEQFMKLRLLYQQGVPPPVDLLHNERLFDLCASILASLEQRPSREVYDCALDLLSFASCRLSSRMAGGARVEADASAEAACRAGLSHAAQYVCSILQPGFTPGETLQDAQRAVSSPVAAAVVVHAIHSALTGEDFFSDPAGLASVPHLLVLLMLAVRQQPCVHERVLRLLATVLPIAGRETLDIARAFLHILLELLLAGTVLEALDFVCVWAKEADAALVRSFVIQVLAHCDAPYSEAFVTRLLALMVRSGIHRKRELGKRGDLIASLLNRFAVAALAVVESVTEGEQALLKNLASNASY